jgi:glycolate oxidase
VSGDLVADLRTGLPERAVLTDPSVLAGYRHDEAHLCPSGQPAVVVLPQETAQVQHVVRTAGRHGVAVVPQGARSGLSGGANAVDGCLVLSLQRMDQILAIKAADRFAVVQPGVVNADLAAAAAEQGLGYPPDPSSRGWSTLGGNVATNAGGLCCVKYGVTADFVLGLEVVLADGSLLRTGRRTAKGVAGYDLTRLFVGSEGTLGVLTEITLALRPAADQARTLAAVFLTTSAAGRAVAAITAAGCLPSLLEVLDGTTLRAIEDLKPLGTPSGAAALLLAQCDTGVRAGDDLAVLADLCREAGALDVMEASDAAESDMLLEARRLAYPALARLGVAMVEDVAVPRSRLAEFLDGVDSIAQRAGLVIGVVGHAGDGNMHPTVVFERGDEQAAAAANGAFDAIMQLGLDLGGTITGEHGVGLLKREWLERELGPVNLRVQHGIKNLLDPQGLLNPGKVLRMP